MDKDTQQKLDNLAITTKRPKSFFVKEALNGYLDDMADYLEAQKRTQDPSRNLISIEELEKALDV